MQHPLVAGEVPLEAIQGSLPPAQQARPPRVFKSILGPVQANLPSLVPNLIRSAFFLAQPAWPGVGARAWTASRPDIPVKALASWEVLAQMRLVSRVAHPSPVHCAHTFSAISVP